MKKLKLAIAAAAFFYALKRRKDSKKTKRIVS